MKKTAILLSALLTAITLSSCVKTPTETPQPDTVPEDAAAEDTSSEPSNEDTEPSPSEQQAYTPRHYITRDMVIEDTLRYVTDTDSAYIVEWLKQNDNLSAYYPSDCIYEPAGRVVIDDVMYYFIYVSTEMTNADGEKVNETVAELLLAMDYSEAYECWWLTDKILIYDNEELLGN